MWVAIAAAFTLANASAASAAVVTVGFEGEVWRNYFGGVAPIGSSLVGSFSYDTDLLPSETIPHNGGWLAAYLGAFSFDAVLNGVSYSATKLNLQVLNDAQGQDIILVTTADPLPIGPNGRFHMVFMLTDYSGSAISDTHLPLIFPDLGKYEVVWSIWEVDSNRQSEVFPLRSAVPEPSIWAMSIIGFGAVGTMLRTRRRRTASIA